MSIFSDGRLFLLLSRNRVEKLKRAAPWRAHSKSRAVVGSADGRSGRRAPAGRARRRARVRGFGVAPVPWTPPRSLLRLVFATVAAVLLSRPGATRADVSLVSFDTADLPLRFVGAAEHYLKVNDACGVCGGDSKTCMGCDGVPNSLYRYDACGVCGDPASDAFNADCLDCAGVLHGASAVDDCGVCRDPADAAFSRAGVPDSHLGGCVGCDGIPNSGNELDACGVCAGLGCEPDDPTKRSWCCDCAETAFGTHVVDFCCACVDRASHWHALSGGAAEGPPAAHALAEDLWRQGRDALAEQSAAATAFRDARDESRARARRRRDRSARGPHLQTLVLAVRARRARARGVRRGLGHHA